jgi:hypothetical protein
MKKTMLLMGLVMVCVFASGSGTVSAGMYTVTNTNDTGVGSLRQAITDANGSTEPSSIVFHIPQSDAGYDAGTGTWTIKPKSKIPAITKAGLAVDGGSQAVFIGTDTNPNGPEIVLDGTLIPTDNGLTIKANDVKIWELVINRFSNSGTAVLFEGVKGGEICGCYIGTDAKGMAKASNSYGIRIASNSREVQVNRRGDKPSIISGNTNCGICISNSSNNNFISENFIGLNRTCDDTLGNGAINGYGGVYITDESDSNKVLHNFICGDRNFGIMIYGSSGNNIGDNLIGMNDGWVKSLGNTYSGIWIVTDVESGKATGNSIGHNQIGYNGGYGVEIGGADSYGNRVTENAISMNQQNGISLSNGGNKSLSSPIIQSVTQGRVTGTSNPGNLVELFCDEQNQGRFFLGSVTADGSGNFSLDLTLAPLADKITATATDAEGNTSAFSTPVSVSTSVTTGLLKTVNFTLEQNYPNPFNPTTLISYSIPKTGHVKLTIYDVNGREVAILVQGRQLAGTYRVRFDGRTYVSGIYFCKLEADSRILTQKMILLK